MNETHYGFREIATYPGGETRLIIPHGDTMLYEYPADEIFDSPEQARHYLDEFYDGEEDWVIVKVTEEIIETA